MNHHDPAMAAHHVGGDGGRVATAGMTARGVPGFKGVTVTSPADVPPYDYAPIPQSDRLDRGHSGPVHP
jgi:hypothetical protein